MSFCLFFRELWFRIKLYYLGIHFYEVVTPETSPVMHNTSYMFDDVTVHVSFRRIPCRDLVLKRGKLTTENYSSYAILATFDEKELDRITDRAVLEQLKFLSNKAFFFNGHYNRLGIGEHRKLELITDVYMDFISALIKKQNVK